MTQAPALTLGEHLRRAREKAGMSQAALAIALGVSRPTLSKWERDQGEPSVIQFRRLINATAADWLSAVVDDLAAPPDPHSEVSETLIEESAAA